MQLRYFLPLAIALACLGCEQDKFAHDAYVKVGGSGSGAVSQPSATDAQPAGTVKLDLKSVDQLKELIASKKGKVVVVDAWSTYCDPCMKEFPGLVGLHKKYGPEKIACISFCMNYVGLGKVEDEIEPVIEFLRKQGATFDNILSTDEDSVVNKKLDIKSVPAIFIYDRDGKLVKLINTETTYAEVEKIVAPLMQ